MGSAARFSDAAALSPKPATHAGAWTAPLSTADMERAVVALVKHRGALAPALALLAGGPHAEWLDALGRVRQRRRP
jgi:hypothetical protein